MDCYAPSVDDQLANALGRIVEIKDRSTGAHTWRVAMYAQLLAESADLAVPDLLDIDESIGEERAAELIMTARAPWFEEAESEQGGAGV